MNETEMLRQMTLNIAARVGVLETIAEGLLVAHARLQGLESLRALTHWMQMAHQSKPPEEDNRELAQWLRNEEAPGGALRACSAGLRGSSNWQEANKLVFERFSIMIRSVV
ncbi:hypothetical protein ACT2FY_37515 [Paraburkholderia fungorum]|uniref:hypothetical protein n=1 Tax=Paraburkholderia fungorum TaxID=134537 RepID=UPI00402B4FEB